jgi:hypothetical protein
MAAIAAFASFSMPQIGGPEPPECLILFGFLNCSLLLELMDDFAI